jgi:hypothetical protein
VNHLEMTADSGLDRVQRIAMVVAALGILACVVGVFLDPQQFFRSYLLAYVFWIGLALGSLGVVMLHNLVGGRWGVTIRSFIESGMRTLPLMAVLVIPILAGIPVLYHWVHPDPLDAVLRFKQPYLNVPFFIGRTVFYFIVWIGLMLLLSKRRERESRFISAPGIIIFVFTVTFAAVDWIMSLEPHWYSTIYGAILLVGQTLNVLAFSIILLFWLSKRGALGDIIGPEHFHDLGNLMLAFTVLWAYTSFSQYLIIWSGNIPEETTWYTRRSNNGWQIASVALIVFHFAVPFFVLLSRFVKRRGQLLARVAAWMILARLLDLFYWIVPTGHADHIGIHWLDIVAVIALGGIWITVFAWLLKKRPLIDLDDPRLVPQHGGH